MKLTTVSQLLALLANSGKRPDPEPPRTQKLVPFKFEELSLGSIKPLGWLKDQLQLSADGLAGHEYDFYRFVRHSTWLDGYHEYSALRESAPYWFNYIVPLAYALDDERLKAQVKAFVDRTLVSQWADGWLGPEKTPKERGMLARGNLLFGLNQYIQAEPDDADRVLTAIHRFVNLTAAMLEDGYTGMINPKDNYFSSGGHVLNRAHEVPTALMWLYENHPRGNEERIWTVMDLMFEASIVGERDWSSFWTDEVFPQQAWPSFDGTYARRFTHGVDAAEGLRWPAARYRLTKNHTLRDTSLNGHDLLFKFHGAASGTVTAHEQLAGRAAHHGSEVCMAVETMFSMAWLWRFYGRNDLADRAEKVAFNAFPAQMTPDHWAHQYLATANQPWAFQTKGRAWENVGHYGIVFGLEPNYPCCTVNHAQGYPKFLANSWARKGNDSLVHVLLSPSRVHTVLGSGGKVSITANTTYPFNTVIHYTIFADEPFTFYIRIPDWAVRSTSFVRVNSSSTLHVSPDESGLQPVHLRSGKSIVTLTLGKEIKIEEREEGAVAIHYGPLLYSLELHYTSWSYESLPYEAQYNGGRPYPPGDGSMLYKPHTQDHNFRTNEAETPWNVAIDPDTIRIIQEPIEGEEMESPVWDRKAVRNRLKVRGCVIWWDVKDDILSPPPVGHRCRDKPQWFTMVPYGSTRVRMTELPIMVNIPGDDLREDGQ